MRRGTSGPSAAPSGTDAPPRWLDPEQQVSWRHLAQLMYRIPAELDLQLQRDAGLNYFEYAVLATLSEQPGRRLLVRQLAALTEASVSRVSHALRRLDGRDLTRREVDPDNRRNTYVILTDEGARTVEFVAPGHVELVRALIVDVVPPEELLQLGAACARILTSLRNTEK